MRFIVSGSITKVYDAFIEADNFDAAWVLAQDIDFLEYPEVEELSRVLDVVEDVDWDESPLPPQHVLGILIEEAHVELLEANKAEIVDNFNDAMLSVERGEAVGRLGGLLTAYKTSFGNNYLLKPQSTE